MAMPDRRDEDCHQRDEACARALKVPSLAALNFADGGCFLISIYPCKQDSCKGDWRACPHAVHRFQSTKNSKRHVHALLFWKAHYGVDFPVRDDMLGKDVWQKLDSLCDWGVKYVVV